jgi:hypothetical protein
VEQLYCRWSGIAVVEVCYFRFGNPAGYLIHEPSLNLRNSLVMGLGPFFSNSLLGAMVAFPSVLAVLEFRVSSVPSYILAWLGISMAMHALPSADDAVNLWHAVRGPQSSLRTRLLATPIVGLMCIISTGRLIGLDLVYGAAMVAAPPALLLFVLR